MEILNENISQKGDSIVMAFEETPLFDIIYNIFFVLCMPIVGGLAASLAITSRFSEMMDKILH